MMHLMNPQTLSVTLPKYLSSEINDVVREPLEDSHFTDSTKPLKIVIGYEMI